ncbi:MAG: Hsp70 family protein [Bacteroidales bacterium]|jgi:molecular chaperone DnaK
MKINYGIYIGTSSASIAKMEAGEPVVIRSIDKLKYTTPIAVAINKKGNLFVGDKAYDAWKSDSFKKSGNQNSFIEFTRTLGTDKKYFSSNANRSFSSEELLAEVIQRLISYDRDQNVYAAVITIPSSFKSNQIDAVRQSGYLAGLKQVEIITEDQAAALSYGLDAKRNNGFSLVFKFTSNDFNTALIKSDNGFLSVIDTEGDNYLGGKNLDYAIVDQLIIPHIQERFSIDDLLSDDIKKEEYRSGLKFFAEEIKNNLSFNPSHNIYVDVGECGEDDEGEKIEIDLTVTQEQLKNVFAPIFQRAINNCLELLKRNNLNGSDLNSLILAGKPTYSPILRGMLFEQICEPDTSIDPETVIVKGAAIYASTIDLKDELKNLKINRTKIQLEIGFEPFTNETEEFVTLKLLEDKTEGKIPEKVFAEIKRGDNAWSSGKVEINEIGEVIDVKLNEGKTNVFEVTLYDDKGNLLKCEPSSFSIIQGLRTSTATLPYNIGTEIKDKTTGKIIFSTIRGLEKNQSLPATGTLNGIKTKNDIRPGVDSDFIKIPLYQGEHGSEGTRAIYNEHVYDIIISGTDLPCLLPKDSDIDLTISVDKSQQMTVQAYFPSIDFTSEIEVSSDTVQSVDAKWLSNEIRKAKGAVSELKRDGNHSDDAKLKKAESELEKIEKSFENNKNDVDGKQEVLTNLRKTLKTIDELIETTEWPKLELQIISNFNRLEKLVQQLKNDNLNNLKTLFKEQTNEVIRTKDIKLGNALLTEMIDAIERIEKINEKYDREYLQLYENGEMTLLDVKESLEEANRQDGIVYKEVLALISQENKKVTKVKVEDLLFKLTEDGLIPANAFQEFYEQLSNMNGDSVLLEKLNNDIKAYESK